MKASRSSRVRFRIDASTRRFSGLARRRLQTVPLWSVGTIGAQVPVSIVSVGFLPPHQQLEVPLQQLVVASPRITRFWRRHFVLRSPFPVSTAAVRDRFSCDLIIIIGRTFQQCRQVFLEVQDQASKHWAVLAQVQHCFLVLTFEMVVAAIRARHSHDPFLDQGPGILAQPPGPGAHVP